MINLLDYKDFEGNDGCRLKKNMGEILRDKLNLGLERKELIYTQELRGIGKTYELINFAKENHLYIVVANENIACKLIEKYNYPKIVGQQNNIVSGDKCVIDEGVDIQKLLTDMECRIVTGYTNNKNIKLHCGIDNDFITTNEKPEHSFSEKVVKNLKEEVDKLEKAKNNALKSNNFSDYKLLINNYKEVVRLIQDLDYKLMYSEYGTTDSTGVMSKKQVAVWEQNGDGNIRNHKIWDIKQDVYIK